MRRFVQLLAWLLLRPWRAHPVRQALTIFSIGLGIALYLATELTLGAIEDSVRNTQQAIAAGADLTITRGSAGVTDAELARLRERPEFAAVAGSVQFSISSRRHTLTLLGVEPAQVARMLGFQLGAVGSQLDLARLATDPSAIVLTRTHASRIEAKLGEELVLTTPRGMTAFTVAGIVEVPEALRAALDWYAFLPLQFAQRHLGREGKVDRVDLALAPGTALTAGLAAARACVAPGAMVASAPEHADQQISALSGFRAMLVLESLLALLVALFFIFNTVSAAIADRTRDAGLLRSLGLTRAGLGALLLAEAACAGLLGLALGVGLGLALGKAALGMMVESVHILYFKVPSVAGLRLSASEVLAAAVMALGVSMLAAAIASRPLLRPKALDFLRPVLSGTLQTRGLRRAAWLGLVLVALSFALPQLVPPRTFPIGRAVSLLLPAGIGLIAPGVVVAVAGWLRSALVGKAPLPLLLALDATRVHPTRTAMTITAFALSLGLVVGHGGVGVSMTSTLREWLVRAIPGDLIIGMGFASPVPNSPFEASVLDGVRTLPGVADTVRLRLARLTAPEHTFMCLALDLEVAHKHSERTFIAGEPEQAYARCVRGEAVLISENLAFKAALRLGDELAIPATHGTTRLPIAGILRDYNSPLGTVYMDYALYARLFEDTLIDYGEVILTEAKKRDPEAMQGVVESWLHEHGRQLWALPKQSFIGGAIQAVEDVNNLSFVQIILASVIGSVGIMVTVMLSVLARRRELALLRAVGMDKRALRHTVMFEVAGLAAAAALVGLLIGNVVFLPANLVFREFAGFTFPYRVPVWHCLGAVLVAAVTAVLSMLVPLRSVQRLELLSAMAEE